MKITVKRLTQANSWIEATESTVGGKKIRATWDELLEAEHSPIRAVWFRIRMEGIPAFVSTHFVRHHVGVEHYVQSMRDDRGGDGTEGRNTPVLHTMNANAQALINMARKRLCRQAHKETRDVMSAIREAVGELDDELAERMVSDCLYCGGICHERKMCGRIEGVKHWKEARL
jgi:thymidylate synthase ThyX